MDSDITITGGTLQVGDPTGNTLQITGAYAQTGGEIVFDVFSDGQGGFVEGNLVLNPQGFPEISNTEIVFDFGAGADPSTFSADGLFNVDTFFKDSDGSDFLAYFGNVFSGDKFMFEEGTNPQTTLTFDPSNGDLGSGGGSSTPEPGTPFLLLPGLGVLGFMTYRRSRNA